MARGQGGRRGWRLRGGSGAGWGGGALARGVGIALVPGAASAAGQEGEGYGWGRARGRGVGLDVQVRHGAEARVAALAEHLAAAHPLARTDARAVRTHVHVLDGLSRVELEGQSVPSEEKGHEDAALLRLLLDGTHHPRAGRDDERAHGALEVDGVPRARVGEVAERAVHALRAEVRPGGRLEREGHHQRRALGSLPGCG